MGSSLTLSHPPPSWQDTDPLRPLESAILPKHSPQHFRTLAALLYQRPGCSGAAAVLNQNSELFMVCTDRPLLHQSHSLGTRVRTPLPFFLEQENTP